jgi:hypothetical protein
VAEFGPVNRSIHKVNEAVSRGRDRAAGARSTGARRGLLGPDEARLLEDRCRNRPQRSDAAGRVVRPRHRRRGAGSDVARDPRARHSRGPSSRTRLPGPSPPPTTGR